MFSHLKKCIPKGTKLFLGGWKRYFQNRPLLKKTRSHYHELEKSIFSKEKIAVASYVVFDSTFGAYGLMDLWIKDARYEPKIVIIPDVSRGREAMLSQYERTKKFFVEKYGAQYVADGYDAEQDRFLDLSSSFDLAYMANPYDGMVNHVHSIAYLSTKNVLPFIINYGFLLDHYSCEFIIQPLEISLCWKVFAESRYALAMYRKYQLIHGRNCILSGYSKMDELNKYEKEPSGKKTIILAPHHSIMAKVFALSNFLTYADLISRLPELYPDVQFVFRPHPLLLTSMVNEGIWTYEQADAYVADLKKKGVIYSTGGDYLKVFKNSDAMIHDCASFIAEYLFTGNPCCFVSKKDNRKFLNQFGMKCLTKYVRAWSEQDILSFIDDVVSGKLAPSPMPDWFRKNVAVNYPDASTFIYEHLLDPVR